MKRSAVVIAALLCLLCFAGIVSATEMITDGDFSETTGSGFTYWDVSLIPPASTQTSVNYAQVNAVSGSGAHFVLSAKETTAGVPVTNKAGISQSVNLQNVDTLTFKTKKGSSSNIYPDRTVVMNIIKGGTVIGSYVFNDLGTTSSWKTQSVDITQFSSSGQVTLEFRGTVTSEDISTPTMVDFYITDVSAIESAPMLSSAALSPLSGIISAGSQVSLTYAYTGSPASASKGANTYICWGDSENYYTYGGLSGTETHTYTTAGTYTISMYASNPVGRSTTHEISLDVVSLSFDVYGASAGNVPFDAEFTYTASNNIQSISWDFGDGTEPSSATTQPVTHRYTTQGVYDVTLTGTTTAGRTYTVTKEDLINTQAQSISFGAPSYDVGSTATINWALRDPDFATKNYWIYVYPATADGTLTSQNPVKTYQIPNALTTSTTWLTNGTQGGYYSAYLLEGSTELTHTSPAVSLVALVRLTVNLATAGVTYTNSTDVTIFQNGVTIQQHSQVTTGQTVFNSVPTGTYQVQAITQGYATQTATVVLTESASITIDFITGTTDDTGTGMGSQYAANYVTFRCYDSGTGKPLSGVTVNVVGVEATNPIEWMANLLGNAWGSVVIGTNLSGISDDSGVVTFAMVPNVRYQVNVIYGTYTDTKVFQPSTLTGEYPLQLDITKWDTTNKFASVVTSVTPTANKTIIANYTDQTATTQALNISLYEISDDKRVYITSQSAVANTYLVEFTPESPSGRSYIITFNATTTKAGSIGREYAIDFNGPRIKIGSLPDEAYMIISFILLVMVGAVGTIVTSRMYALVVVIVAAFLWYAGWLFALGAVGWVLLLCFVLAIIYYIAHKSGGGD